MINPENLIKHELIGLKVKIAFSGNKSQIGINGEVVDETKNTIVIRTETKNKTIIKAQAIFLFTLTSGEEVKVEGRILVGRSQDRAKKRLKKW